MPKHLLLSLFTIFLNFVISQFLFRSPHIILFTSRSLCKGLGSYHLVTLVRQLRPFLTSTGQRWTECLYSCATLTREEEEVEEEEEEGEGGEEEGEGGGLGEGEGLGGEEEEVEGVEEVS